MDMSSFPKMLQFKQKMVPHQQLLRWSEWFSKYDFESFYLKGSKNTLADMLSRNPPKEINLMSTSSRKSYFDFDANMPEDTSELILSKRFHESLRQKMFLYQSLILSRYGINSHYIAPMGVHPDYPFAHLFRIEQIHMPEEVLCFLWYFCAVHTIGITFDIQWLYQYIHVHQSQKDCLSTFLTWFVPLHVWSGKIRRSAKAIGLPFKKLRGQGSLNPFFNPHTIYFFHRPLQLNEKTNKVHALPNLIHHKDYPRGVRPDFNVKDNQAYEEFQTHAFRLNSANQTFPIPFNPVWNFYPMEYHMSLDEDLQYFMEKSGYVPKVLKTVTYEDVKKKKNAIKEEDNVIKEENPVEDCPPEYFQDAQLPEDDSMNIDEIGRRFNIEVNTNSPEDYDEPEDYYKCPNDYYGCCDKHIIQFEMEH